MQLFLLAQLSQQLVLCVIDRCIDGRLMVARDQALRSRSGQLKFREIHVIAVPVVAGGTTQFHLKARLRRVESRGTFDLRGLFIQVCGSFGRHLIFGGSRADFHAWKYTLLHVTNYECGSRRRREPRNELELVGPEPLIDFLTAGRALSIDIGEKFDEVHFFGTDDLEAVKDFQCDPECIHVRSRPRAID